MSSILFYDPICPRPYTLATLRDEPMGGTEATVLRVAEALAMGGYSTAVMQHNRDEADYGGCAEYLSPADHFAPTNVVVLRSVPALREMRKRFPQAKLYLWLHDLANQDPVHNAQILADTKPTIIVVSDFHALNVKDKLSQVPDLRGVAIKRIYNPIDDSLVPDATPVDRDKLVFFSSPHKGLAYTLQVFSYIRRLCPEMQLYVANPGYLKADPFTLNGVTDLGPRPHSEIIKHVRSALCTFYPNTVFPETFGLVLAESNAVGTPCLTHPHGAAAEVLFHPHETLDCRNYKAVVDRVLSWRAGNRPTVKASPEFRLSRVVQAWKRLLT